MSQEAKTLAERMAALNEGSVFLPPEFLQQVVFPQITASCLALVILYNTALVVADKVAPKGMTISSKRKMCYQFTNLCANLVLTLAGLYFEYWIILPSKATEEESTQGFEEVIFMSCFQFGFQLWAIPVGFLYVNESPAMIAHHFTVIAVSIMSGFLRNGFRYWTPFFYGIIEISSLPLSIMNFFKDNPTYIKNYPQFYKWLRIVFGVTFIWVRIVMFVPRLFFYLRNHYLLFSTHPLLPYRMFMATAWLSSFFLLILQIYWSSLILKAPIKYLVKINKQKASNKTE